MKATPRRPLSTPQDKKIKNKRRLIVMAGVRWASRRIRIFRPPQTTSHAARLGGKPLFFL